MKKTLYVRDQDAPMWARFEAEAKANSMESVSSLVVKAMYHYLDPPTVGLNNAERKLMLLLAWVDTLPPPIRQAWREWVEEDPDA